MTETGLTLQEARKKLAELIQRDVSFEQKTRAALDLGRQYLRVDNGHLTRIDQETDHWETMVSTDSENGQFPSGLELDLGKTYCRRTLTADSSLTVHDAPNQGWANDPAFQTNGLHCYHGTTVEINGNPYGTLCFVATDPRPEKFSDEETMFVELISRELERELEYNQIEAKLTRQTNLATVLNRVLRHNLRNEMSIIRGFTQLMADKLEDTAESEIVLDNIDNLIELSDKANSLDRIVDADLERQHTDVIALVENIVEAVSQEYTGASISLNYDEKVTAALLPSFEQAVEELIENAAKHSGENPTVTVTITMVPNAVEIQVADNGPGVADDEIDVLTTGEETPLTHGSGLGLWLVYWIITSHDGSIDVAVTDAGTEMTLSVPRKPATNAQERLTKLTRARDRYEVAFKQAYDAMIIVTNDHKIVNANPAAAEIFGQDNQALLGRSLREFLHSDIDFDAEWRAFQRAGVKRDTLTVVGADGVERSIAYSGTANIVPGQHLFVARDITEQKERERKVSELKERYRILLEAAPDPVFVANIETEEIIETNAAAETLVGESRDRIVGRNQTTLHPAEDADLYREAFEQHRGEQTTIRTLPNGSQPKLLTADGEAIPIEISVCNVSLPDGPVMFGLFRDISERVERERELEEITQRLNIALEGTNTGVWEWDLQTDEVIWSESMERLFGLESGTFDGTFEALTEYIDPEDLQATRDAVEAVSEIEKPFRTEYRIRQDAGEQLWGEAHGEVHEGDDGSRRVVGTVTDNTNRLNEIFREINEALVRASTQDGIEKHICEIISAAEPYRFAWIGEHDSESEIVSPRTAAGLGDEHLEEITITTDESHTGQGPTGRAVQTGELTVMQNIPENPQYEPWRESALKQGFKSSVAIPLVYDDTRYGVLNVYADREYAFNSHETRLLSNLGETIAHAYRRIELQQQHTDQS